MSVRFSLPIDLNSTVIVKASSFSFLFSKLLYFIFIFYLYFFPAVYDLRVHIDSVSVWVIGLACPLLST